MVLPRPAGIRRVLGQFSLRRAGAQPSTKSLRQIGRRTYADHAVKKSSDLPWMIGAVVFTVPAASWLWAQGPTKSEHGHGHEEHSEKEEEAGEEEAEDSQAEVAEEESEDKPKGESEDTEKKAETKDDKDAEGSESDGGDEKDTPETSDDEDAGKGKPETKGEKDSKKDTSGAKNPHLDDPEKSKKGEGIADTAKIHGTVDSARPGR